MPLASILLDPRPAFHRQRCSLPGPGLLAALSLLLLMAMAGCRPRSAIPTLVIRLTPAAATLRAGDSVTLSASCTGPAGDPRGCPRLTWTAEGGLASETDTVAQSLRVVASQGAGVFVVRVAAGPIGTAAALTVLDGTEQPNLILVPEAQYQTLRGWDAALSSGWRVSPAAVADLARRTAGELGLTRLRLEITGNQVETRTDLRGTCGNTRRIIGANDNDDPTVLDSTGFNWHCLDEKVKTYVLPIKREIEARGERLLLSACYVGFMPSTAFQQDDPAEYAELVVATLDHLRSTFGLVPDLWEVRLEPDNDQYQVNGAQLGRLVAAAGPAVRAAGYADIRFSLPSTKIADNALPYFREAMQIPGAAPFVAELVYHRYRAPSAGTLAALAAAAREQGIETAMLEYMNATEHDLWEDLTLANVSSWEKYALAGPVHSASRGNQLYFADVPNDRFLMRPATWPLRQYFHYLRPGAVRIGTRGSPPGFEPVAFRAPSGGIVIVVNLPGRTALHVAGLPPGTYHASFSTPSAPGATGQPITIADGGLLSTSLPEDGTVTLVQ